MSTCTRQTSSNLVTRSISFCHLPILSRYLACLSDISDITPINSLNEARLIGVDQVLGCGVALQIRGSALVADGVPSVLTAANFESF